MYEVGCESHLFFRLCIHQGRAKYIVGHHMYNVVGGQVDNSMWGLLVD
jgi:hypothetical protein